MLVWVFSIASTIAFILAVLESLVTYPNLFSALAGLTDSSLKADILIAFACTMAILWTKLMIIIFLTELTNSEVQVIYQRGWLFLCNIIFMWGTTNTGIQDNPYNVAVCVLSIFILLVLHWICSQRVENTANMVLSPTFNFVFNQARFAGLSLILFSADIFVIMRAISNFRERNYTLAVFSFIIIDLMEMSTVTILQYLINIYGSYYLYKNEEEDEWDKLKVFTSGVKFIVSLASSAAHMFTGFGVGANVNTYGSLLFRLISLYSNGNDFLRALRAQHELDTFTVIASQRDLDRDNICVICRDEMECENTSNVKLVARKLRCGHVMHSKCLVSWLSQSQSCPTCRQSVKSAVSSFRTTPSQSNTSHTEQTSSDESRTQPSSNTTNTLRQTPSQTVSSFTNASSTDSNGLTENTEAGNSHERNGEPIETNGIPFILRNDRNIRVNEEGYTVPITMHQGNRAVIANFYEATFNVEK